MTIANYWGGSLTVFFQIVSLVRGLKEGLYTHLPRRYLLGVLKSRATHHLLHPSHSSPSSTTWLANQCDLCSEEHLMTVWSNESFCIPQTMATALEVHRWPRRPLSDVTPASRVPIGPQYPSSRAQFLEHLCHSGYNGALSLRSVPKAEGTLLAQRKIGALLS